MLDSKLPECERMGPMEKRVRGRRWAAAVLAASVTMTAACSRPSRGSGDESGPVGTAGGEAARLPDPCALLSAAEIASTVGREAGPPARTPGRFAATCKWASADGTDPEMVHVMVAINEVASYDDYVARTRHAKGRVFSDDELRKVEGLGNFAVWAGDARSGALQIFSKGRLLQVTAAGAGNRSAQDVATALARLAMPRLR